MLGYLYGKRFGSKIAWALSSGYLYLYPNISEPNHSSHLPAFEDETDSVYRNVGI
jgi:hypothetical protein